MPYHSFLLRIWSVDRAESTGSPWRATLVSVHDGGQRTFTRPEALLEFLSDPHAADALAITPIGADPDA